MSSLHCATHKTPTSHVASASNGCVFICKFQRPLVSTIQYLSYVHSPENAHAPANGHIDDHRASGLALANQFTIVFKRIASHSSQAPRSSLYLLRPLKITAPWPTDFASITTNIQPKQNTYTIKCTNAALENTQLCSRIEMRNITPACPSSLIAIFHWAKHKQNKITVTLRCYSAEGNCHAASRDRRHRRRSSRCPPLPALKVERNPTGEVEMGWSLCDWCGMNRCCWPRGI